MARARRLLIAFALVLGGIFLGFAVYTGFVQAGLLPNPFGPVVQGDLAEARSDRPGRRVLFVGNSLTYWNDMPDLVSKLAEGDPGAKPLFAVSLTGPGWSLRRAERDPELRQLLQDMGWDAVVLQEHSSIANKTPSEVGVDSVPAAMQLAHYAGMAGAETVVFMNWMSRHRGDLADQLGKPVAPFASAWDEAYRQRPDLDLLDDDGRHPNLAGSYLAACVVYATLTGRDPTTSTFTAGLPPADARFLQRVAAGYALKPRR
jgi:hypothetical protein